MRLALGIGCDRGTPAATIAQCIETALIACGATLADVCAVASIDLKANEAGLQEVARKNGWMIRFFSASELAAVPVPNPSEIVRRHTGTPSVAEAAALLVAGAEMSQLLIEKNKLRGPDGRNATISIARMSQ